MHLAAPPRCYCLVPGEELREYMRRSIYLAAGGARVEELEERSVAAVGDYTFARLLEEGIEPVLGVVDCETMREWRGCPRAPPGYRVVRVRNPRGAISWEAWEAVADAFVRGGRVLVIVEGEEDLVAIPVILESPDEMLVAYGVPWAGLNVVEAAWAKPLAEYIARSSRLESCLCP